MGLHIGPNRIARIALGCAAGILLPLLALAQQPKISAPHDPIAPRAKRTIALVPAPGSIAGGIWIVDAHDESIIYLKNVVENASITVTPVLYLSNGTKIPLAPVQLAPSGIAEVDIGASLESMGVAPLATLSGWVELQYDWPWVPICAFIRVVDVTRSLVFSFGFAAPGPLTSHTEKATEPQVREGMWWKQEKNVTGFLTLANTTLQPINALVEVEGDNATVLGSHTIAVPPQGMATLDMQELLTTSSTAGGIRVSYVGGPDALLINGGLEDVGVGYSANLPFAEPMRQPPQLTQVVTPQSIAELGLMTGPADPWMSFPDGTTFTPYSVLRNISNQPINATPTLWWMQGSAPVSYQLPSIRLLPWQTYSLDMPSLLAAAGLKNFSGSVNLVFDTQGQTGLLMAAGSVDQTNTYVFEVAPRGIEKSAGKNLSYWSTASGDDTMVTIWNPADEAQTFIFRLIFAGGHYDDVMTLGPRATKMFDISEIIATSGSDPEGNIIPAGVQEGSAKILGLEAENQHLLLAVDSGVYNVRKATCFGTCTTCDGATSFSVVLNPFGLAVNAQTQESLIAPWNTGAQYNYTNTSSWSSNNTSIATVQTGLVHGVSPGSFTTTANFSDEPVYAYNCNPALSCPWGSGSASAPGNVFSVTITGADITQDSISVSLASPGATLSGQLTIKLTGPNGANATVYNAAQGTGTHSYSFNLSSLPTDEFTQINASWTVNGVTASASYNYHIRVLGNTHLTQYNTPSESQCSGSPQTDLSFDNSCHSYTYNYISGFISRVTNPIGGTGSGHSISHGDVYQEFYCSGYQPTSLRINQTIKGSLGPLSNSTLAACPTSPDYVAGAEIYIQGVGVKTVTDRCPACCNDLPHFDNYTTNTQCSGIGDLPRAITVRIY